jgi:hypothetical protein
VTLDVDTSSRFRTGEDHRALVEAVLAADPLDEARWIEWKSNLDLSTREHQFKAAKTILGFANRTEEQADGWAEGYAYLLVGVEPGSLGGTTPLDTSVVDAKLRKWVGGGDRSPRWSPHWVTVNGSAVLIIEVGPPLPGDPLFPLRQQFESFRDGTIFVRRQASSDPADAAEVLHLSDRAARSRRLSLTVDRTDSERLGAIVIQSEVADEILEIERAVYLKPLRKFREERKRQEEERRERMRKENPVLGEAMSNFAGKLPDLSQAALAGLHRTLGPQRTEEQYETEVKEHIDACRPVLTEVILTRIIWKSLTQIRISITNPTERHIPGVRVVGSIEGSIFVETDQRAHSLPEGPRPWDEDYIGHLGRSVGDLSSWNPSLPIAPADHAEEIQRPDGIEIRWPPTELPALETIELEPIDVAILASDERDHLMMKWRATSSGLDGVESGEIGLPVRQVDPGVNGIGSLIWDE